MGLTESGQKVFEARYAARNESGEIIETFEQAAHRIAEAAASAEKTPGERAEWLKIFEEAILNKILIPSTPIWANLGKSDRPWQPSACFVLEIEDSLSGMYKTLYDTAMVFKSGGGVGYNFSSIRPKGDLVMSTKGKASGVVELIKLYNSSSNMVMQGGVRRGASKADLNVDHPEIMDYIKAKTDEGSLTNFNLSVGITDKFIGALDGGLDWELNFEDRHYGTIPAREIWDSIIDCAYKCGDPGLTFLDRLQESNPVPKLIINTTNPCLTGDTRIPTDKGLLTLNELYKSQEAATVLIDSSAGGPGVVFSKASSVFCTGIKPVFEIETDIGLRVRATEDHKFLTPNGYIQVKDLYPGEFIKIQSIGGSFGSQGSLELGRLLGWYIADGSLTDFRARLDFYYEKAELAEEFLSYAKGLLNQELSLSELPDRKDRFFRSARLLNLFIAYGLSPKDKLKVPEGIFQGTEVMQKGFLQALFTGAGTVNTVYQPDGTTHNCDVRLSSISEKLLLGVQVLLLNFGIVSRIHKNRYEEADRELPDHKGGVGIYHFNALYELVIDKSNRDLFARTIGLLLPTKQNRLDDWIKSEKRSSNEEKYLAKIVNITRLELEPVYDLTEPLTHSFIANGFVSHNCGEQPLHAGESCLLSSLNLAQILIFNGLDDGMDKLEEYTRIGIRFLDNIIDIAKYPLDIIDERTRATRKIGLGFTGLADVLIAAHLPYDSAAGRDLAGRIARTMSIAAYDYSSYLGTEKGNFPEWENSLYAQRIPMRNACRITIAPTGSVTAMAGCEGYGIEPIFGVAYSKKTNVAGEFRTYSSLFLNHASKYLTPAELARIGAEGTSQNNKSIPKSIRDLFKGAHEISPLDHLLMQAEVQKHVDNAISKTINMPTTATRSDIDMIYRKAFELGLKGITIFRDGCKEGTIIFKSEVSETRVDESIREFIEPRRGEITPRPTDTTGTTHKLRTGCGKIYLTINKTGNGDLMETFITTGSDGGCLIYTEAASRLISLALRGGIAPEKIVEQLNSCHPCPSYMTAKTKGRDVSPGKSCPSAIAHTLWQHISKRPKVVQETKDHQAPQTLTDPGDPDLICPECKSPMERAEGCLVCRDCGYSKC